MGNEFKTKRWLNAKKLKQIIKYANDFILTGPRSSMMEDILKILIYLAIPNCESKTTITLKCNAFLALIPIQLVAENDIVTM